MSEVIAILCDLRSSYSRDIALAAFHVLRTAGMRPVIAKDLLRDHPTFRVKGYVGFATPEQYEPLTQTRLPVVNVSLARGPSPFANVWPDNVEAGRLAARHLLERGYHNVAFAPHWDLAYSQLRGQGVAEELQQAGAQFQMLSSDRRDWPRQLAGLPRPIGIIGGDDTAGFDLLDLVCGQGMVVPEQVAVVGITNDDIACATAALPMTSVDLNPKEIGQQAARLLIALLQGRPAPRQPILVSPHGVVVRASSDAFATTDKLMADILQFARTHLHEGISVDRLAQTFGMSRRHLSRMFLERLSLPPSTMLQRLAVAQAKNLLANSNLSIAQVAARCGYDNLSHFGVLFRHLSGTTPAAFRQQHRTAS